MSNSISLAKLRERFARDKKASKHLSEIQNYAVALSIWRGSKSRLNEVHKDEAIVALVNVLGEEHLRKVNKIILSMISEEGAVCTK